MNSSRAQLGNRSLLRPSPEQGTRSCASERATNLRWTIWINREMSRALAFSRPDKHLTPAVGLAKRPSRPQAGPKSTLKWSACILKTCHRSWIQLLWKQKSSRLSTLVSLIEWRVKDYTRLGPMAMRAPELSQENTVRKKWRACTLTNKEFSKCSHRHRGTETRNSSRLCSPTRTS